MRPDASHEPPARNRRTPISRARSLPHRKSFVTAVIFSALFYLGIIAILTCLILFFIKPNPLATRLLVLAILFTGTTWLFGYFKRTTAFCPLCKGTPLIKSGALVHANAFRLPLLNYGVSATFSIIATQKFRCMYCGTQYDLLKRPTHQRLKEPSD